jgi:hypothetical protein
MLSFIWLWFGFCGIIVAFADGWIGWVSGAKPRKVVVVIGAEQGIADGIIACSERAL